MDSNRTGRPSLYHVACDVAVSDTHRRQEDVLPVGLIAAT